ncbi:hypothetical protein XENTR_v10008193 [Xenopus tropicalis]|nr:hypothetical protein XENTR_v10008193 [Xenopus tropicalis]
MIKVPQIFTSGAPEGTNTSLPFGSAQFSLDPPASLKVLINNRSYDYRWLLFSISPYSNVRREVEFKAMDHWIMGIHRKFSGESNPINNN